ncbi:MAG: hypothetical protein F9K16_06935 [Thermoanaerobaculia bacterium]|nr:MAG: hypothetical protein F9K16_06935 [Thermoanaerobaculia bacterium]MBZ0103876.1 hypothetical protein [Thermoanaerobaculia bacterium]
MRPAGAICLVLTSCLSAPSGAQLVSDGAQLQVNSYTIGLQSEPAVSRLADGSFLVVWESEGSPGGDVVGYSVQARRLAADGTAVGPQFQVNSSVFGSQRAPAVTALGDAALVVWHGPDPTGNFDSAIVGRYLAPDGSPDGADFVAGQLGTLPQLYPAVAALADGGWVVTWVCGYGCLLDNDGDGVVARRFSASGEPDGPGWQVNSNGTSHQRYPAVAALAGGAFVIVWESDGSSSDPSGSSVHGQRYAADGAPAGGEFLVNSYVSGDQRAPGVAALPDGGFVVVWDSVGSSGDDSDGSSIQARRFAADGSPVDGGFQVNAYTTSYQGNAAVHAAADGGFVVAWQSVGSFGDDTSFTSIQAQLFEADGTPDGEPFQVNSYTTSYQGRAVVAGHSVGPVVVAWHSDGSPGDDDDATSVQTQLYQRALFVDGFEDGTTGAWSASLP